MDSAILEGVDASLEGERERVWGFAKRRRLEQRLTCEAISRCVSAGKSRMVMFFLGAWEVSAAAASPPVVVVVIAMMSAVGDGQGGGTGV